jgi:tetratricopeptide (TPR) repeat protein
MDTPVIRTMGALLCLGLSYSVLTEWNPRSGPRVSADDTGKTASLMAEYTLHRDKGEHQAALEPARRLYLDHPRNHVYIEQLATVDQALGKYQEAAELWEQYLQYAPTPIEGCPQIGVAYRQAGQKERAVDALKRCLAFEANNPDVLYYLGDTYQSLGHVAEAEAAYRKGLSVAPNDPDLVLGLARIDLQRGQAARAAAAAAKVLERWPDNSDALLVAGLAAIRNNRLAEARRYLERGARISGRYADIQLALASLTERERHARSPGPRR